MAKMKAPLLEQIDMIEERIVEYLKKHPTNSGDYSPSYTNFDKDLRNGIVFYRQGWGWRLRKGWRETLDTKRQALKEGTYNA